MSIQVAGNATVSAAQGPLDFEAIDSVEVSIDPGAEKEISLQPGPAERVSMLLIKSSRYTLVGYKAKDGPDESTTVKLDAPHLFTAGTVELLKVAPKSLKFKNSDTEPVQIQIFVARSTKP